MAKSTSGLARLLRFGPPLAVLLAAVALLLLALVPLGWRSGWWGYRFSLLTLMPWSAYCGAAAVSVSALALTFGRAALGRGRLAAALVALALGGSVAYVPLHYRALARSVPRIDDVTTDTVNPPAFLAAVALRKAAGGNPSAYGGARIAALQKRGYPDLAPLPLSLAPDRAFALALATAKRMGWTILATDREEGRIEATDRTMWMAFPDDIVVRIAGAGPGSRVDMRSGSRYGRSDLGVNAARIRAYFAALRDAAKKAR